MKDLTNLKFGRWTVLRYSEKIIKNSYICHMWECQCNCGTKRKVYHSSLTKGRSLSCGCYNRERVKETSYKRKLPPGELGRNQLFLSYKRGSSKRNIIFKLSLEEFTKLTKQNCYYCDSKPLKNLKGYIYNGIDRKDNDLRIYN